MKIEISSRARLDLREIYLYTISHWSNDQGKMYLMGIENMFGLLKSNPHLGMSINSIIENSRYVKYESHFIIYQISKNKIMIDRILHIRTEVSK